VDEVQVHLVNTEPPEALLGCGNRVITPPRLELGPWIELGGEKYLAARHAAVAERLSDALLVAVSLGRVDKAIPCVERPAYGVHARRSVGNLPDAQTEHRHLVSIGEDSCGDPLLEKNLATCGRLLGAGNPRTQVARNNLVLAYQDAVRAE
jgi:hypothetical protein